MEKAVTNTKRRKAPAAIGSPSIIKLSRGGKRFRSDSLRTRIITHFLMDLDTLRLRLIEKFIGYQLRWMNEWENPSAFFFLLIVFRMNSFAASLQVRQKSTPLFRCRRANLPDRADLRDCGLFGQSPLAKTYSAGNHAPTSKEAGAAPTTTTTLCCGHFFKRWLRELGVHSARSFFCNEVRNSHFTKLPLWWRCRQAGIPQNAGMQRGLKLSPKAEHTLV
jgi:hypothetical protein